MTDEPSAAKIFGSDRMWGLKELPLPEPVSWWPQTPGWFVLAVLVLLGLGWVGWRLWRRYQRNAYRRDGLAQLDAMLSDPTALNNLPFLLRKSALKAGARNQVAGLRGEDWIAWLNDSARRPLFKEFDGDALDRLAYAGDADRAIDDAWARHLVEASKAWMRSHRVAV